MNSNRKKQLELLKDIQNQLENYEFDLLNECPQTQNDLYGYFYKINQICDSLERYLDSEQSTFPIHNEVRACFGHITEYIYGKYFDRVELAKAYGHFRRCNLDLYKIICDEFEKSAKHWLAINSRYDFSNIDDGFMSNFLEKYYGAKEAYKNAQEKESSGRNSNKENILKLYYEAAINYVDLTVMYSESDKTVRKAHIKGIVPKITYSFFTIIGIIGTLSGIFLSIFT